MSINDKLETLHKRYGTWNKVATALKMSERRIVQIRATGKYPQTFEMLVDYLIKDKKKDLA